MVEQDSKQLHVKVQTILRKELGATQEDNTQKLGAIATELLQSFQREASRVQREVGTEK